MSEISIPASLAAKLASVVVHASEIFSRRLSPADREELYLSINDSEVKRWLQSLGPLSPIANHSNWIRLLTEDELNQPMWDALTCARYLKESYRNFNEVLSYRPDFIKAVSIKRKGSTKGRRIFSSVDVRRYAGEKLEKK